MKFKIEEYYTHQAIEVKKNVYNELMYTTAINNLSKNRDKSVIINQLPLQTQRDSALDKDFQKYNFFEIDMIDQYTKYQDNKGDFIDVLTPKVLEGYYLNYKKIGIDALNAKYLYDTDELLELRKIIILRLNSFYDSFEAESFKQISLLNKANELNLDIEIISSDKLDSIFGIDFYLIINNKYCKAIHSINGTKASFERLAEKNQKQNIYTTTKGQQKIENRVDVYEPDNHFVYANLTTGSFSTKNMIKNVEQQATRLLTDDLNPKSKKEFDRTMLKLLDIRGNQKIINIKN